VTASPRLPECPRVRDDVVFRALAREWVVYDPVTRNLHVLNVTAAMVWSLCDGEHAVDHMVQEVRDAIEGAPPEDTVRRDVLGALETLASRGLLR
jgi:hypothetical protein